MLKKIYLAGPLFTNAEQKERISEAKELRELGYSVYNPVEHNEVDGERTLETSKEIFQKDIEAMEWCDIAIINLDHYDSGTMIELGWFLKANKKVYAVWTDFRSKEPNNLFILGSCNWKIYNSFRKAVIEIIKEEQ